MIRWNPTSVVEGRAYVVAYVDFTHTLEGIEAVMAHGGHHSPTFRNF